MKINNVFLPTAAICGLCTINNSVFAQNTAYGTGALVSNTTGTGDAAFGYYALGANTSGSSSTACGYEALYNNTVGYNNNAFGLGALGSNTSGNNNTGIGAGSLFALTTGTWNIGLGTRAGNGLTTGSYNICIGDFGISSDNQTIRLGTQGTQTNTFIAGIYGTTSSEGMPVYINSTGQLGTVPSSSFGQNSAYGVGALYSNTSSGINNSAFGYNALYANTIGTCDCAFGYKSLAANTSGTANTAYGYWSLFCNTDGFNNNAFGYAALYSNTSGYDNTAIGGAALSAVTTGTWNIALGTRAGNALTTGSYNICIGDFGTASDNKTIRLGTQGNQTNTIIAGIYGATAASGVPVYVNSSGQLGTLPSSARFKQNIQTMGNASDVLLSLHPVTFSYKPELDSAGISQYGLIAEEVAQVDPKLVARDDKNEIYTVRYQAINAMLLNEFLKQHQTVEEQKMEIATLKEKAAKVDLLEQRLNDLAQSLHSLAK